jgi:hypothetical protein
MIRQPDRSARPLRAARPSCAAHPLRAVAIAAVAALAVVASLAACRPDVQEVAVEEEAIRAVIARYADLLSQAYAFTDSSLLEPVASQRERAAVETNVRQLADQGQRIATDLKDLQIEELRMSDLDNAYVQTFETWEIRVMDLGSERVISVDANQRNRVRYQLKRQDGEWRVLWRQRTDAGATPRAGGAAAAPEAETAPAPAPTAPPAADGGP